MVESTIAELIEIQSGYTSFVDLESDLFNSTLNAGRMANYRPITSHRTAFEKLAKSLNMKDNRCYLLTGSYGTGKSHLCLMFANYLQIPAGEPPMPRFFDHYAAADAHAAEDLKTRRTTGRYLIATCQYAGKDDFDEVILRAVDNALKREGFTETLDTAYLQARKKIGEWQNWSEAGDLKGRFYDEFVAMLTERNPGQTLANFDQKLAKFDHDALEEFKRIHQAITTAQFGNYDKADLIPVLTSTLSSQAFKDRFLGLLILFDEFGDTMERGYMNPKAFQRFAQFCAQPPTTCAPVIFVGTAHKPLTDYAKVYNATEFRTASDRLKEVGLTVNGVEDIIAAIVAPQKTGALWQDKVVPLTQTFDEMLKDCKRLNLFDWLTAPKIRNAIIENIYPMHPMATYALLQLARDVASNNRSVFLFFSGELGSDAPLGSYGHFIATNQIETKNKLNLYTPDLLCDYFSEKLQSDNKELRDPIRECIRNYESSVREQKRVAAIDASQQMLFSEDPLIARILRLMLIYQIIQIPNTIDNLQFGLYLTLPSEQVALQNRLNELINKGILYRIKDTGIYEFKQSTGVDLDRLVEAYTQDPKNLPADIAAELHELVPFSKTEIYLEAKDYNQVYGEDKRLERRMVRAIDLSTEQGGQTYFDLLEGELARKEEYEGIALYAICETAEEIQKARDFCAHNTSQRIVVAIPKQPIAFRDTVLELRALRSIDGSTAARDFSYQDKAALHAKLYGEGTQLGAEKALRERRNKLLSNREVIWYGRYAQFVPTEENKFHDVANKVMEAVYASDHNTVTHEDLNKLHIKLDRNKIGPLREAVEKLLHTSDQIIVDTSFAQARGDIRYLQKCLLNSNVLTVKRNEGSKQRCDIEEDPRKYAAYLPSLAIMVQEVQNLKVGEKIHITEWLKKFRKPPYGQGPVFLALALAYLCRRFGDSIRFKADEAAVGDLQITSFEVILGLIDGQYPNAFLSYRQLRREEKDLVNVVYALFGQSDSAIVHDYSVAEATAALKQWWQQLPSIAHVENIYSRGQYPYTADFIKVMQQIATKDAHSFLFDNLPTAFGADAGQVITQDIVTDLEKQLPQEKAALESAVSLVEQRIMEAVRVMFNVEQSTYSDTSAAIQLWYNNLDTRQKDAHESWQNNDSRPLVLHLKSISSLPDTFLDKVPSSAEYGLRSVRSWTTDRVKEYVARLERGKKHIEANRLKVEAATIQYEGEYRCEEGKIYFKDQIQLKFQHIDTNVKIYLAEGNSDPRMTDAERTYKRPGDDLIIRNTKTLKIAVQDHDGNWSKTEVLALINEHGKYEIHLPAQKALVDEQVTIVFPTTADAFAVTCRSLFALELKHQVLTIDQLTQITQTLLDDLKRDQ